MERRPFRELTYPTFGKPEHHLQYCFFSGHMYEYVSFQERTYYSCDTASECAEGILVNWDPERWIRILKIGHHFEVYWFGTAFIGFVRDVSLDWKTYPSLLAKTYMEHIQFQCSITVLCLSVIHHWSILWDDPVPEHPPDYHTMQHVIYIIIIIIIITTIIITYYYY